MSQITQYKKPPEEGWTKGISLGPKILHLELVKIIKDHLTEITDKIKYSIQSAVQNQVALPASIKVGCYDHLRKMLESEYIDAIIESLKSDHTIIPGVIRELRNKSLLKSEVTSENLRSFLKDTKECKAKLKEFVHTESEKASVYAHIDSTWKHVTSEVPGIKETADKIDVVSATIVMLVKKLQDRQMGGGIVSTIEYGIECITCLVVLNYIYNWNLRQIDKQVNSSGFSKPVDSKPWTDTNSIIKLARFVEDPLKGFNGGMGTLFPYNKPLMGGKKSNKKSKRSRKRRNTRRRR